MMLKQRERDSHGEAPEEESEQKEHALPEHEDDVSHAPRAQAAYLNRFAKGFTMTNWREEKPVRVLIDIYLFYLL